MFNDQYGLTQAVLDGRKTMTRRIISRSTLELVKDIGRTNYPNMPQTQNTYKLILGMMAADGLLGRGFYRIGEELAIAQSYRELIGQGYLRGDNNCASTHLCTSSGYRNKMFVDSNLMPHVIRITNMWFERLNEISNGDAIREGVYYHQTAPLYSPYDRYSPWHPDVKPYKYSRDNCIYFSEARYAFQYLCKKLFGANVWTCNPIVCAYDFVQIK